VVHVALRLGIDTFSVKGVSQELGVTPAAVYRHFSTRDNLMRACVCAAFSTVEPLKDRSDRESILRLFSDEWWKLMIRYPGLVNAVSRPREVVADALDSPLGSYGQGLMDTGISEGQVIFAGLTIACSLGNIVRFHRDPRPDGADGLFDDSAEQQRQRTIDFIVSSFRVSWPAWSLPINPD
jgi:AcrR family transcriptional regulator